MYVASVLYTCTFMYSRCTGISVVYLSTSPYSIFQQLTNSVNALLISAMPSCREANSASFSSSFMSSCPPDSRNPPWTTFSLSSLIRLRNASLSPCTQFTEMNMYYKKRMIMTCMYIVYMYAWYTCTCTCMCTLYDCLLEAPKQQTCVKWVL